HLGADPEHVGMRALSGPSIEDITNCWIAVKMSLAELLGIIAESHAKPRIVQREHYGGLPGRQPCEHRARVGEAPGTKHQRGEYCSNPDHNQHGNHQKRRSSPPR